MILPVLTSWKNHQESMFYAPREKLEEARDAGKCFSNFEGDHLTLLNVYRASAECIGKSLMAGSKEKVAEKILSKWCKENFINNRSLRHARDIHRKHPSASIEFCQADDNGGGRYPRCSLYRLACFHQSILREELASCDSHDTKLL